ncbi:hypothetical protein I302_107007 [Kwoniella bestiolae CBS 10118]|uniref:Matrin-type domain-containing protein n=1 Tax=Kwoniella bestiolae CBS 10118 TaxID=1296100 RepID=A0A1B9FZT2_9TREE|nr:hypothetical protein I302_05731 [Kwoniella bestiolae CBS 10118]OCF24272.1 hypothetical protein I302_05731 [Kwoniella bestiolae CBS 10118]
MTEYWVSKKQYYCKYCSIYIRDDAPSRKQHVTGLKHIGNVERYIRDLYKSGSMAKKEKAEEAAEMARIEAAAAAAYANDKASGSASPSTSKPSILQSLPSSSTASSSRIKPARPTDKYSNYSTAEQLGYKEEKSEYEIQQEIKNAIGQPSAWETVEVPQSHLTEGDGEGGLSQGEKRKWAEEDDEHENFKIEYDKPRKPIRDPYDDDWDPSSLKSLKVKKKEERIIANPKVEGGDTNQGLNRGIWTGKLELNAPGAVGAGREGLEYVAGHGWVKKDDEDEDDNVNGKSNEKGREEDGADIKPEVDGTNGEGKAGLVATEPELVEDKPTAEEPSTTPAAGGMFKKRRPPPSSRKK